MSALLRVGLCVGLAWALAGCGHSGGAASDGGSAGSGGVAAAGRTADGVPIVPAETYVSTFKGAARPLALSDVSTWTIKEQYGLGLYGDLVDADGVKAIATSFTCSVATPADKASCLEQQKKRRADSIVDRLNLATGKDVKADAANALPAAKEDESSKKLTWLTLCDAACVAKAGELGGVTVTLDDVEKRVNAKLQAEHDKKAKIEFEKKRAAVFADVKPDRWAGDGPWWQRFTSRLVPYIDGSTVLIGVGKLDSSEGKTGPTAMKAAGGRARAELAKALLVVVTREAAAKGVTLTTEAKLELLGTTVPANYETNDAVWAMAMCDQDCMKQTLEGAKVALSPADFKPGAVE